VDHATLPVLIGVLSAVLATAYGLLPERLDLTHVFAAYGAGAIAGDAVAARNPGLDPGQMMRRWGLLAMAVVAIIWTRGLLVAIL
jgi:hypothetical protein